MDTHGFRATFPAFGTASAGYSQYGYLWHGYQPYSERIYSNGHYATTPQLPASSTGADNQGHSFNRTCDDIYSTEELTLPAGYRYVGQTAPVNHTSYDYPGSAPQPWNSLGPMLGDQSYSNPPNLSWELIPITDDNGLVEDQQQFMNPVTEDMYYESQQHNSVPIEQAPTYLSHGRPTSSTRQRRPDTAHTDWVQSQAQSQERPWTQSDKTTIRFSREQVECLDSWLYKHKDDPYLNKRSLAYLASQTGLNSRQIQNWFSRARQTRLPHSFNPEEGQEVQSDVQELITLSLKAIATSTRDSASVKSSRASHVNLIGYLEQPVTALELYRPYNIDMKIPWWIDGLPKGALTFDPVQHMPPSIPAPVTIKHPRDQVNLPTKWKTSAEAIKFHTKKQVRICEQPNMPHSTTFNDSTDSRSNSGNRSENDFSVLSGHSNQSATSNDSSYSAYSSTSYGPRKGRRRVVNNSRRQILVSLSNSSDNSKGSKGFLCKFCAKRFPRKSTCKRHEESIHAPKTIWICPRTLRLPEPRSNQLTDGLCGVCNQPDNKCMHCSYACSNKPVRDRTFYRRDAFVQHLTGVHRLRRSDIVDIDLRRWEKKVVDDEDSRSNNPRSRRTQSSDCDDSDRMRSSSGHGVRSTLVRKTKELWHAPDKVSRIINHII